MVGVVRVTHPAASPALWERVGVSVDNSPESLFKYKKEKQFKPLIFQNRRGQFPSANGQFRVFHGQRAVVILVKLCQGASR